MIRFALLAGLTAAAGFGSAAANPVQAACASTTSGMITCQGADKNKTDWLSVHVSSSDGKLITSGMISEGKAFSFKKPSMDYSISVENEKDHHRQIIAGKSVK
jgi:hypothetical protein